MGQESASWQDTPPLEDPPWPAERASTTSPRPQPRGKGRTGLSPSITVWEANQEPGPVMRLLLAPQPRAAFSGGAPIRTPPSTLLGCEVGVRAVGSTHHRAATSGTQGANTCVGPFLSYLTFGPSAPPPHPHHLPPSQRRLGSPGGAGEGHGGKGGARGPRAPAQDGACPPPSQDRTPASSFPPLCLGAWPSSGSHGGRARARALPLLQEVPADGLIWPGVLSPGGI